TTANLFSGFFGIVNAIGGQFEVAALAIIFSCVFDILDGKVARLTRATSRFGVEYDSLADLVAFGVGPGLLMYLWALKPYGRLGWLAAFVFMACGALRLARFNVQVETVSKTYFVGLPIPGGAGMVATTVLFLTYWKPAFATMSTMPLLLMTYVLGFLMVSTLPYYSFKDLEFVKAKPLPILFAVVVMVSIIAMNPTEMLFALMLLYILSGPVVYVVRHVRGVQNPSPAEAPCPPAVEGPVRDQAGQQPAETERDGREQP
ncbi:MAG: CDP-diacylglycerol--serine O-phosphatidyltransferase, partial [Desulfobacteraceae bacterium]|nr:CDP-diacylglycerol--serine O-phosphatidyltransferase [Desulfobacteraceae bacterium]